LSGKIGRMSDFEAKPIIMLENMQMALMRVRRMAQLTLPAEVRRALNVQEGDFLEATIVNDGVLQRERAWQRIEEITSRVRDLRPDPRKSNEEEEEEIAESIKEFCRKNK
jgi:bifunctional DNA-binding transcriptional regulator/antitoxin component of YhaV-PrlF toxin-antitoxin module